MRLFLSIILLVFFSISISPSSVVSSGSLSFSDSEDESSSGLLVSLYTVKDFLITFSTFSCMVCGKKIAINAPRYHCLQCAEYDLCMKCKELTNIKYEHKIMFWMIFFNLLDIKNRIN
jgi:hypothetical protein